MQILKFIEFIEFMRFLIFVIFIVSIIITGKICMDVAKSKGHHNIKYFWFGFFFGIFGLLIVIGISDLKAQEQREKIIYLLGKLNQNTDKPILNIKEKKKIDFKVKEKEKTDEELPLICNENKEEIKQNQENNINNENEMEEERFSNNVEEIKDKIYIRELASEVLLNNDNDAKNELIRRGICIDEESLVKMLTNMDLIDIYKATNKNTVRNEIIARGKGDFLD